MTSAGRGRDARLTARRYAQRMPSNKDELVTFNDERGVFEVTFPPEPGQGPDVHRLEGFISRPVLAEGVAHFFRAWGVSKEIVTRAKKLQTLRHAFVFLDALDEKFGVDVRNFDDIDTQTFRWYIKWLDGEKPFAGRPALGESTKIQRYRAFADAYAAILLQPRYQGLTAASIPKVPWRYGRPDRQPLNLIDFAKLLDACRQEMRTILAGLAFGAELVQQHRNVAIDYIERTVSSRTTELATAALFKYMSQHGGTVERLRVEFPRIGNALKNPYLTVDEAVKTLVLTCETAVPFVLFLAAETAFNPTEVLGLRFSNCRPHPAFEGRNMIVARKGRKGRNVSRSYAANDQSEFSVSTILERLARSAAMAKELGVNREDDHVFVCHTTLGQPPKPMYTKTHGVGSSWYRHLADFLRRNELVPASLTDLRLTVSDIVNIITDGDVLAQQRVLNHATSATTLRSYGSAAQIARRAAKLSQAMAHRQRVADSLGRISLNSYIAHGFAVGATPGFRCLDPMTSPVPGQFDGRPCSAYGKCPSCPHGVIDLDDEQSVARLRQIELELREAQRTMLPLRWFSEWHSALTSVEELLTGVRANVLSDANGLSLSPLPKFE